ncbi:hypothetical protein GCM10025867_47120 (plasmid) [Frondihabitans sucicola]|uniref:Uncharacterized protein n=1 Tax=Frondihabitans sucicola TaxID=1268041 RepID=A0ABN6Y900_9MICO|nr:hypothetical protein [Frondihabitans sucicola]BDZ52471.1 hypothetical protein GCM10025867_47120 [Frondihabitans sucicola]
MNAPGQTIHRAQVYWFGGSDNSQTLDKHLPRSVDEAVESEAASITENEVLAEELVDANDNGIPDAWEVAGAALEAQNAAADKEPHRQAFQQAWAEPGEASGDESVSPQPQADRAPVGAQAAPPGFPATAPNVFDDDAFDVGFSLADLDEIAAEAAEPAEDVEPASPSEPQGAAPATTSWMPQRRPRTPAPSAPPANPAAAEPVIDPTDDPTDALPLDPFEDRDESVVRVVGPSPAAPYKPLAASESDVVDPSEFMGGRA